MTDKPFGNTDGCVRGRIITIPAKSRSWGEWRFVRRRCLTFRQTRYEVDLWTINCHHHLVDWLFHISRKGYEPHNFLEALKDIFEPAAWTQQFKGRQMALEYWKRTERTASSSDS